MKWFKWCGVGLFLLTLCFTCLNVIYASFNVFVVEVSGEQTSYMAVERVEATDELVFGGYDWIADGIVRDIRAVEVKYRYMDADITDYLTLLDFEIQEVVYNDQDRVYEAGQTVTVLLPFSTRQGMYLPGSEHPILQTGTKALLFGMDPASIENDALERAEYADIWCGVPYSVLIEKKYGCYLADSYFEDALGSDAVKNAADEEILSDGKFAWVETCIQRRRFGDDPANYRDDPGWSANYCICDEATFKQLIVQKAEEYRGKK